MSLKPELTIDLLARLIDIGRRESFDEFNQLLVDFTWIRSGKLMRQGHDVWLEVARLYSSADVEALIKALTMAERELPNFNCGSVSPVIPLYQHLFNLPDADLTELRDWVVANTRNVYLPFGSARYHPASWPEYVSQQKEVEDRRLAREQEDREALAAQRAARQMQQEEHHQSRFQIRQSREALIDSLKHLAPTERLAHIIGDNTHPVTFYPAEWAVLDPGDIQRLPQDLCLAAIKRLADRRTGIWKKLREQLELNNSEMSTSILHNINSSTPELGALLPVLLDSSPRPDGTLTEYEEKVRLAWPLLVERFYRIPSCVREARKLDAVYLIRWLGSHWMDYPEPDANFVPKS